jgi:ElaB/YqjD/DUF883 family membrane-anchored ribosome-binding protein
MDRSTSSAGNPALGGNTNPLANPLSNPATQAKVDGAAQSAHKTVDAVAGMAADQVDRLSGTAHRAVNGAAGAAASAADWASRVPAQAQQIQAKVTDAACVSIRARPIASVAGALAVGYLIGRLARW